MVLALAKWRYSLVIIMRLGYVIIYVIRLFLTQLYQHRRDGKTCKMCKAVFYEA